MDGKQAARQAPGNKAMMFAVTLPMLLIAAGAAGIYVYESRNVAVADVQNP